MIISYVILSTDQQLKAIHINQFNDKIKHMGNYFEFAHSHTERTLFRFLSSVQNAAIMMMKLMKMSLASLQIELS